VTGTQDPRHLLTSRLDLRALTPGDLDSLHPVMSNPRNCAHVHEWPMESLDASRAWIERFSARWAANGLGYWIARLRETSTVIGVGGADRRTEFWNLFYLIDWSHWGHGYATELALAARHQAAALEPGLPIVAWIHRDNTGSQAIARRLGLTDYGQLEARHLGGQLTHRWADRQPAADPSIMKMPARPGPRRSA
jgi:RimJ/RimL family protein N-acetyltransferase